MSKQFSSEKNQIPLFNVNNFVSVFFAKKTSDWNFYIVMQINEYLKLSKHFWCLCRRERDEINALSRTKFEFLVKEKSSGLEIDA